MSDGIPEHLKEGWKAFREWAEAMAMAGEPLPPGGCFVMSRSTILKGCLIRLHCSIASELKMPLESVTIKMERNELTGLLTPSVDVTPPDGWLDEAWNLPKSASENADEFATVYIEGVLERYYKAFRADLNERLERLDSHHRPDLVVTEIEDLIDAQAGDSA